MTAEARIGTRARVAAIGWVAALAAVALLSSAVCAAPAAASAAAASGRPDEDSAVAHDAPLSIELESAAWIGDLDVMAKKRAIRVLVPYSKTLYFVDLGGVQRGACYDFMRAFEEALNKKLGRDELKIHAVFIPVSRDHLIPMLLAGQGDVIAANMTVTPERSRLVEFVAPVATGVRELVVTRSGGGPLRSLDDLAGTSIYVRRDTSYFQSLLELNERLRGRNLAQVRLREAPAHFETEDMLEMVNGGLVPIVIADDYLAHFWRRIYPDLDVHDDLAVRTEGDIAFAVRKDSPKLKAELDAFTATHRQGTLFGNVTLQKYLQQTRWASNAVSAEELKKFDTLVTLFRRYGEQYRINWLLMAAQGYQESQLDQTRRSAVGAIGVMQLMPETGREMHVGDITQLEANIHGGVKYVRYMVDAYYKNEPMTELDKTLFAFASYNAGPERIRALRREAAARKLDPNVWFDNVERVAAERIGRETVQYVSNIYKYYIAYSLVQGDVERTLERASAAGKQKS
jgi:membrane-bound lytic murein transglycosylase MltF